MHLGPQCKMITFPNNLSSLSGVDEFRIQWIGVDVVHISMACTSVPMTCGFEHFIMHYSKKSISKSPLYLKGAPNFGPALHSPPLPPVNTLQKLILYLSRRCTKLRARTPLPSPPSGGSPSSRGVVGRHSKALFGALSIFSAQPLSPNYPRCAR